ncbi:ATP synthase-coupling factor 6, mitochondrial-like [Plodia interpunctella]|uniref:ATP synthase-coupling factor 6, mitochondrial-like n=1 Tax=Plodia interpunctella TaxID=58824 RepID=UPI0023676A89|nr:ATP synthase-coupling factor 6, mitochondrial-like [Plodia interpunctella]
MLARAATSARAARGARGLAATAASRQEASDPVQKLFLDKIREYKSKSSGGQLVDPSPTIEKELKTELEKLERQYGGGSGVDMMAFPSFKFDDAQLDPIDEASAAKDPKKKK